IECLLRKWQYSPVKLNELSSFRLVFIVRTIPGIPYPIQNYMLALAGVPFIIYWPISWVIQSIFAAGMTAVSAMLIGQSVLIISLIAAFFTLLLIFRFAIQRPRKRKAAKA